MPTNTLISTIPAACYKVSLIYTNQNNKPTKTQVENILFNELQTPVSSLNQISNGFLVRTDITEHIDKIITNKNKFAPINLIPRLSKTILAKRTLIIRFVDESVTTHSEQDIQQEIERQPNNQNPKIDQIIKIPFKTRTFKIVCTDIDTTEKLTRNGLYLYNYRVTPSQIVQEEFIPIQTCFKCYRHEDHPTHQCTTTTQYCSNCAGTGHTYRECSNSTVGCVNCKNRNQPYDHHTLAMRCPYRKEIVKEKSQRQNQTYAQATSSQPPSTRTAAQTNPTPPAELNDTDINRMTLNYIQERINRVLTDELILQMAQNAISNMAPTTLNTLDPNNIRSNVIQQIQTENQIEDMDTRNQGKRFREDLSDPDTPTHSDTEEQNNKDKKLKTKTTETPEKSTAQTPTENQKNNFAKPNAKVTKNTSSKPNEIPPKLTPAKRTGQTVSPSPAKTNTPRTYKYK